MMRPQCKMILACRGWRTTIDAVAVAGEAAVAAAARHWRARWPVPSDGAVADQPRRLRDVACGRRNGVAGVPWRNRRVPPWTRRRMDPLTRRRRSGNCGTSSRLKTHIHQHTGGYRHAHITHGKRILFEKRTTETIFYRELKVSRTCTRRPTELDWRCGRQRHAAPRCDTRWYTRNPSPPRRTVRTQYPPKTTRRPTPASATALLLLLLKGWSRPAVVPAKILSEFSGHHRC